MCYHCLDEFSYDINTCPVSTMHNDISFSFVFGEFFGIIVFDVTFTDSGDFR